MPRCDGSGTCSCVIHAGRGMTERGSGTAQDPLYLDVVTQDFIGVVDTRTIDMTMTGAGTDADPRIISADLIARLSDLLDVTTNPPGVGQVLGWNGIEWAPQPNATAAPGAIQVTGGVTVGDGSSGNPLRTAFLPRDFVAGSSGLELSASVRGAASTMASQIGTLQDQAWRMSSGASQMVPAKAGLQPFGPTSKILMEAGSAVRVTDSSGKWRVDYQTPFPNGVLSVVATPGDLVYQTLLLEQGLQNLTGFSGVSYNVNGGGELPGAAVRINYIAAGW